MMYHYVNNYRQQQTDAQMEFVISTICLHQTNSLEVKQNVIIINQYCMKLSVDILCDYCTQFALCTLYIDTALSLFMHNDDAYVRV